MSFKFLFYCCNVKLDYRCKFLQKRKSSKVALMVTLCDQIGRKCASCTSFLRLLANCYAQSLSKMLATFEDRPNLLLVGSNWAIITKFGRLLKNPTDHTFWLEPRTAYFAIDPIDARQSHAQFQIGQNMLQIRSPPVSQSVSMVSHYSNQSSNECYKAIFGGNLENLDF